MPDGRVLIASGDPLAAEPSWERFDELSNCRMPGWDMTVGRQSEFEVTDTGEATILFNDRARVLDIPELVGSAVMLQIHDPTTDTWEPQMRGVIDKPTYDLDPSEVKANVGLHVVDMFAYLERVKLIPGWHGDVPGSGQTGSIFYEDGPVATGTGTFDPTPGSSDHGRIEHLLTDAGIPEELWVAFSGNVNLLETLYDPDDSVLAALRDAADAELPGLANLFCDRRGRICFHGRLARLTPDDVAADAGEDAWPFTRWKAGNGRAVRDDEENGQIRRFAWSYPMARLYNSAIAWPRGIPPADKVNQVYLDETSIDTYGYSAKPPMGDLIVKEHKTNGNTGAEECQLYAELFVENLKDPKRAIETVTIKTVRPTDHRAASTWPLMTRMDISDILALTIDSAGVSSEDYNVEGFTKSIRQLDPDFDYVEVTPNLTAVYTENVFDA